jgi:uncharacterized protein (DUF2336 family)
MMVADTTGDAMHYPSLLEELDRATAQGTSERSQHILSSIADLFALKSENCSDRQIDLFDEIFVRLSAYIEKSARVALANKLADQVRPPRKMTGLLASDDEIAVAGPVIERSKALDPAVLVGIASSKGQQHLLALSRRPSLDEAVTDILVERGDAAVVLSTVKNAGARFSQAGFGKLVDRSHENDELATGVGLRPDLPREHLLRLVVRASHEVRLKLEVANPALAATIQDAIESAAGAVIEKADTLTHDYTAAVAELQNAHAQGRLDDANIGVLAVANEFEKTIVAIGLLCGLPPHAIEHAVCHQRADGVLVLAKAAGLSWATTKAVLRLRKAGRNMSPGEFERCAQSFAGLKESVARQAIDIQRKSPPRSRFGRPAA